MPHACYIALLTERGYSNLTGFYKHFAPHGAIRLTVSTIRVSEWDHDAPYPPQVHSLKKSFT